MSDELERAVTVLDFDYIEPGILQTSSVRFPNAADGQRQAASPS